VDCDAPLFYTAPAKKAEQCFYLLNRHLLDCGYPALYIGNPYDWIFLWAIKTDHPLESFRTFMGEVLAVSEESSR